jgi:hypothetical protein
MNIGMCHGCFIFTVQLQLASPELLNGEKIEEYLMRKNLHLENHPEVK